MAHKANLWFNHFVIIFYHQSLIIMVSNYFKYFKRNYSKAYKQHKEAQKGQSNQFLFIDSSFCFLFLNCFSYNVAANYAPLSPQGACLIQRLQRGAKREGDIKEVGLFTKSTDEDVNESFSVLLPHNLQDQHAVFLVK